MDRDRRAAFLILKNIEEEHSWSNLALSKQFSKEKPQSSAFVREIVYGVLRNQSLLDFNIARFLKKPKLKLNEKILLRIGFYQLSFMDVKPYAAVNETVVLAKSIMPGREGFINAVLRSFQKSGSVLEKSTDNNIEKRLAINYSCSQSIVKLLLNAYADKAEDILLQLCKPAPLSIRSNSLKIARNQLKEELEKLGFSAYEGRAKYCLYISGSGLLDTDLYKKGFFSIQGEASQLCVETLNPKPGETMIDLCAAPGGKTCAAAELMNNEGKIFAFDYYEHRVDLINKEASRLGLSIIDAKTFDSTKLLDIEADCVLCDVPCSGLGTLRRNPELKLKELDLSNLVDIQYQILKNASTYAKSRIVYSTCTINPDENEKQIERFLKDYSSWKLVSEQKLLPVQNGPDGFYIALLEKYD